MKPYWLLGLSLLLASCDASPEPTAVLSEPFPRGETNLRAFPPELIGQYLQRPDTLRQLVVQPTRVLLLTWHGGSATRAEADSLRAATHWPLRIQSLAADSVRVWWQWSDTLFSLQDSASWLRHHHAAWFLNRAAALPSTWEVRRLQLRGGRLTLATLTGDTLRLARLRPARFRGAEPETNSRFLVRPTTHNQHVMFRDTTLWEEVGQFERRAD